MQAYLKGVFVGKGGSVPITALLERLGVTEAPPPMPDPLAAWLESEGKMNREIREPALKA
jgi:hypothetical protein